jgi:hypothetical protein
MQTAPQAYLDNVYTSIKVDPEVTQDMVAIFCDQRWTLVTEGTIFQRMGFTPGNDIVVVCRVPDPPSDPEWYWTPTK